MSAPVLRRCVWVKEATTPSHCGFDASHVPGQYKGTATRILSGSSVFGERVVKNKARAY